MQHSVKYIGSQYQEISEKRNDKVKFNSLAFYQYALNNKDKYHIIETDYDLLVSSWYSDSLINDFVKNLR